jgi:glucose/arabinose dehydrogenase
VALGLIATLAVAEPSSASLDLRGVAQLSGPTYLAAPKGEPTRKFVTLRKGVIKVIDGGDVRHDPFISIRNRVSTAGEGGLLSMAFAPNYDNSGEFYVYYVDNDQDIRVDQYRARTPTRAREASRQPIIRIPSPSNTHKGGQVEMLPNGYLLLATGDGGTATNPSSAPQRKSSLLGKLLRIKPAPQRPRNKPQYKVHPQNPYAGPGRGQSEIMARGLRNPFRFSVDRKNPGKLALSDVGQSRVEEVNYGGVRRLAGANFGWPCFEGRLRFMSCRVRNHSRPDLTYSHSGGNCSITGGYVNRAPDLPRRGEYFFGDFCSGRIWTGNLRTGDRDPTPLDLPNLVSFGQDGRGNLYAVSLNGSVKRIVNR